MIDQLITELKTNSGQLEQNLALNLMKSDPLDLVFYQDLIWRQYLGSLNLLPTPAGMPPAAATARSSLLSTSAYAGSVPFNTPGWYHLGYSYALENTRMMQIFARVVRLYRTGEELGIPSPETQAWLDVTEALMFNAANPIAAWLSTSAVRTDPENVRRNAYWRLFGLDLAFGTDDNQPPGFVKTKAANTNFRPLFEELLHELWKSFENERNTSGANQADPDRIYRIAQELKYILLSRRQNLNLDREELSAATAVGWIELTLQFNSKLMTDLKVEASSVSERLRLIGEKVGLPAHSRTAALVSMARSLSHMLRTIESGTIATTKDVPILFLMTKPASWQNSDPDPIGADVRRVITEWAAASGKDLKARARPVEVGANAPKAA